MIVFIYFSIFLTENAFMIDLINVINPIKTEVL